MRSHSVSQKLVSWVIQLKGVTFSCCVVSGNKGTETQVVLLAALGYSQGVHLVISAVGTKKLLVTQDSVVNTNLRGQQVKPLCEPSCLCGLWGQLGAAYACPGGSRHLSSHHVFPCWCSWSLDFLCFRFVTADLCCVWAFLLCGEQGLLWLWCKPWR